MALTPERTDTRRAVQTLGFVIGVVLAVGALNLQRSTESDIGTRSALSVAAENDMLREQLHGLLEELQVLEGQEAKFMLRVGEFDRMVQVSTHSGSGLPASGLASASIPTVLEARTVMMAGLLHMSTRRTR